MCKVFVLITSFLMYGIVVNGQLGSWNIINLKVNLNQKWGVFSEAQIRSLSFYDQFHYYEIKVGASYVMNEQFQWAIGIGDYDTYRPGGDFVTPKLNDETRIWSQLSMKLKWNKLKFEHRYRAEQRFTSNGFRQRFRYRLSLTIPLNSLQLTKNTLYINSSTEVFATNREPYFERLRSFLGIGYEVSELLGIQGGYLYQFDYNLNDEIGKSFWQISFLFELEWDKNNIERLHRPIN